MELYSAIASILRLNQIPLSSFSSLLQIVIALNLAYIGLDRFRYFEVARKMYKEFLDLAENVLSHNNSQQDALLTTIRRELEKLNSKGFSWKRIRFSFKTRWGIDLKIVFLLLVLQMFSLILTCLYDKIICAWLNCAVLILCLVSILVPGLFVFIGNRELKKIHEKLNEYLENLQDTYTIPREMLNRLKYLTPQANTFRKHQ